MALQSFPLILPPCPSHTYDGPCEFHLVAKAVAQLPHTWHASHFLYCLLLTACQWLTLSRETSLQSTLFAWRENNVDMIRSKAMGTEAAKKSPHAHTHMHFVVVQTLYFPGGCQELFNRIYKKKYCSRQRIGTAIMRTGKWWWRKATHCTSLWEDFFSSSFKLGECKLKGKADAHMFGRKHFPRARAGYADSEFPREKKESNHKIQGRFMCGFSAWHLSFLFCWFLKETYANPEGF